MTKPLLLINHRSRAANSGKPSGISNYLLSLTKHLLDRGNLDVGLATSWARQDLPEDIASRIAFYKHFEMIRPRVLDVALQAFYMSRFARDNKVDAILNIDPIGTPRGAKHRFVVIHDLYFKALPAQFSRRERLFSDLIMRMMLRGNETAICISNCTKEDLDLYYPGAASKAVRVYPDATSGNIAATQIAESDDIVDPYVLWVGTVTANKNIECFYAALEKLAGHGLRLKSVVVGRDPYGLAASAEQSMSGAIRPKRLGAVSGQELRRLYSGALCFVNTSLYEGFGMPVIEAQRSGVPVICSKGGAVAEVAGPEALTFDADDSDALAEKLSQVASDALLRGFLKCAGRANAKRFSWTKAAEEIETIILKHLS